MELIYAIIVLGAIQTVLSSPAFYNNELNENSYSNYKDNYKSFPDYKTSWLSNTKQIIPDKSEEHENEIDKFPFNLKSQYNNDQEQQWNKEYKIIDKKDTHPLNVFEDENEDNSTEDYEDVTIILSEEDLADRIDDALMCSLLGRCFEDQQ